MGPSWSILPGLWMALCAFTLAINCWPTCKRRASEAYLQKLLRFEGVPPAKKMKKNCWHTFYCKYLSVCQYSFQEGLWVNFEKHHKYLEEKNSKHESVERLWAVVVKCTFKPLRDTSQASPRLQGSSQESGLDELAWQPVRQKSPGGFQARPVPWRTWATSRSSKTYETKLGRFIYFCQLGKACQKLEIASP